ncbi:MAG: hypothetical protein ACD_79C00396G0003 [uncultured bacterium]|nr:MAG: hypothetical protein ACD_79C00396G0003 [uncultured bacterium]
MSDKELIEAMRIATKNPETKREKNDLGRFGLGLKTASFSQCKILTVISKKAGTISAKQWNLDYISKNNEWLLITPKIDSLNKLPFVDELKKQKHGTLVIWQNIDRYDKKNFTDQIDKMKKHLSLVFHRFIEGSDSFKKFKIYVNDQKLKSFNPFNSEHPATQQSSPEKIKLFNSEIVIQPFILPHHSKLSQQEYEQYATEEGYTKSQGFYLYRSNRLLIYGTWWGLHRTIDAHKLVRIKIDITNNQDKNWGIDIKKSTAEPKNEIKADLRRIIRQITEKGSRPFTGRGRKIEDKTINRFWEIKPVPEGFRFALNQSHPIYEKLFESCVDKDLLNIYLNGLQAYLPLEAIQAQLQQNPHNIKQETALTDEEILELAEKLKSSSLDEEYIKNLLKTELFKNKKGLLINELSKN